MNSLYLREPVFEDKNEIINMAFEFYSSSDEYPFEGISDLKKVIEKSFETFYFDLEKNKHINDIYPDYVNQTTYVLCDQNNHIYGMINLRHNLNDNLTRVGGHVGYGIRPSERGKGYGFLQLKLLLNKLEEMKIENALLTCRENNIASKKTIEKFCGNIIFSTS